HRQPRNPKLRGANPNHVNKSSELSSLRMPVSSTGFAFFNHGDQIAPYFRDINADNFSATEEM
ncbi:MULTISPECIES: hypothetical protein, partial [unclassified Ruegeria]|uniref:hypothetical protein n=1 Tax=unclassified Ruegeria TaxID=2625375 RepID=UPI001AE1F464